jgi:signal transduction histidine kinase
MPRPVVFLWLLAFAIVAMLFCQSARATILWSEPASRVIHNTPDGTDILGGAVKRDDTARDALYFKFHVDPLSDAANEPYYALFQLNENGTNRLAVGNALEAWGYSAAYASEIGPSNKAPVEYNPQDPAAVIPQPGEYNLQSAHPEGSGEGQFQPYELPNHNHDRTIVFKVQYVPSGDDLVTVWLQPNLTAGADEENQPENIVTKFKADASFNQIRLRHSGGGNGWIFSDMAIATSFNDFVVVRFWQTWWFRGFAALVLLAGAGAAVLTMEKRKFRLRLQHAEQESALERERARIAQDLHDELGSLLTRISLLGGLLRGDKDSPTQVETHATKISQSADQTVRALEEIVWAVRPGSDSLQSLVEYLAHFANEMFEGNAIRCRLDLPQELPARMLPPDVRHNIFLIGKEALTNVLKHAGGTEVQVQVKTDGRHFILVIADDGQGFDAQVTASDGRRNGMENMRRRAEAVGGKLLLTSAPGQGTSMEFTVDFPS